MLAPDPDVDGAGADGAAATLVFGLAGLVAAGFAAAGAGAGAGVGSGVGTGALTSLGAVASGAFATSVSAGFAEHELRAKATTSNGINFQTLITDISFQSYSLVQQGPFHFLQGLFSLLNQRFSVGELEKAGFKTAAYPPTFPCSDDYSFASLSSVNSILDSAG